MAIITVKYVDYCCITHNINKSEANNLLENSLFETREYIYKILSNFWLGLVNLKSEKSLNKDT